MIEEAKVSADQIAHDDEAFKRLDAMLEMLRTVTVRQKLDGMLRLMKAWSAIQGFLKSIKPGADRDKWDIVDESIVDIIAELLQQSRALEAWCASARSAFADISKPDGRCNLQYDFDQNVGTTKAWLQGALHTIKDHFTTVATTHMEKLQGCLPSLALLEDPALVHTKELQLQVQNNPKKSEIAALVMRLYSLHSFAKKQAPTFGWVMLDPGLDLKKFINHGRMANLFMPWAMV